MGQGNAEADAAAKAFIARWRDVSGENANRSRFIHELCDLLRVPPARPTPQIRRGERLLPRYHEASTVGWNGKYREGSPAETDSLPFSESADVSFIIFEGRPVLVKSERAVLVRIFAFLLLLSAAAVSMGDDSSERYAAADGEQPFYVVWDRETEEPVGVIYHDARGLRMVDLTCGESGFVEYAGRLIRLLNAADESTSAAAAVSPATATDTASAAATPAGSPVLIQDFATTEIAELRNLITERGAPLAWRQFAHRQLFQGANEIPDDPALFTMAGFGSFWGMRGGDERLLHPAVTARQIQSNSRWQTSMTVVLHASGVGESPFPARLADGLNTEVLARSDLNEFQGFSDVDAQALSDRLRQNLEAAVEQSGGESAYLVARHWESKAMIEPDRREACEAEARRWLRIAAEAGHAPAQYDLAYVSLWIRPFDPGTAERWIQALRKRKDLMARPEWKADLDALEQDLRERTRGQGE